MKSGFISKKTDPLYPVLLIKREGGYRSVYNASVLYLLLMTCAGLVFFNTPLMWGIVIFLTVNLILGVLLDKQKNTINIYEMPAQVVSYIHLVINYIHDYLLIFILMFLLYLMIRPLWFKFSIWDGYSVVPLFAFLIIFRMIILIQYWYQISFKWGAKDVEPPLKVMTHNFSTQSKAKNHILWSFFIGNCNVFVRCAIQTQVILLFEWIIRTTGFSISSIIPTDMQNHIIFINIFGVFLTLICLRVFFPFCYHAFYKIHRTLHENRAMYSFLHKVHHKSIVTTPLSEGTISPLEFQMSAFIIPFYVLLPDWLWCILQIFLTRVDALTHTTNKPIEEKEGNLFHTNHHLRPNSNYGLFPDSDACFGTLFGMTWSWNMSQLDAESRKFYNYSFYKDRYETNSQVAKNLP